MGVFQRKDKGAMDGVFQHSSRGSPRGLKAGTMSGSREQQMCAIGRAG